ncbi:MAG: integrase catalytic region [Planctomycetaceae bacterium]|nr:integrase catalytic region [Planctomycetaceae bacterium]
MTKHRSIERFNRTLATEWANARPYVSEAERAATYQSWLHHYNHHRTHTGIGGKIPIIRVHNVRGSYTWMSNSYCFSVVWVLLK